MRHHVCPRLKIVIKIFQEKVQHKSETSLHNRHVALSCYTFSFSLQSKKNCKELEKGC